MKLQIILIKKLNYLGKGLSAEEATRLKEQIVKEDTENNTECRNFRQIWRRARFRFILKLTNDAYMLNC